MSSDSRRRFRLSKSAVAAVLLVGAGAAGCGKRGDPMPAPRTIPAAVTDLSVRQRGSEVVLEMAHPKSTVAGLPLAGLDEAVLYELERPAPPAGSPILPPDRREFDAGASERLRIGGAELASAISGDRITLRFLLPPAGSVGAIGAIGAPLRFFGVRTHAVAGEGSDLSNLVPLVPRAVPPAPAGFRAVAKKEGIEFSWASATPAGPADPAPPVGWNLYRRAADRTGYGPAIAAPDAAASSALDTTAVYGERYIYAATAVASREPLVESALSVEREVVYEDRFAPAVPAGLAALPSPGEVRLIWEAVIEPDVAGYVVERADPGSSFHRVGAEPVSALELVDRGLGSGFTFRYRVAAIDRSGNLGEFSPAVEARVP